MSLLDSSLDAKSWEIIIVLSSTLESNGSLLVSHSGSIGLLAELPSPSFVAVLLLPYAFSSYK
jgi:hypothetical protein